LRKPAVRRCTRQAAARAHMHTEPADACAWAHPRWGRAAGDAGACLCLSARLALANLHSVRVVKEQALRWRSGDGEALSRVKRLDKSKGPVPCGDRASCERGRRRRRL